MPESGKVADCVRDVMAGGKEKPNAIRICQASTGLSYATGRKPKKKALVPPRVKHGSFCHCAKCMARYN